MILGLDLTLPTTGQLLSHAVFAAWLLLVLKLTWPMYAAFRRRRSGFGTVFNGVTEKAEALASVSLRDLHGQIVRTTVSDKDGRYRLIAPKGEYTVDVVKHGYTFPSRFVTKERNDTLFEDILPATHIIIKDYGAITKNIAIDPPAGTRRPSFFSTRFHLSKKAMHAVTVAGPIVGAVVVWAERDSLIAWTLFAAYLFVLGGRIFSFKPPEPPFGTVTDAENKRPLYKAVVRIFDNRFNKLMETQITSAKGRYAFIVNRGSYKIYVRHDGYRSLIMKFPHVDKDGTLLVKDVKLRRAPQQAKPK